MVNCLLSEISQKPDINFICNVYEPIIEVHCVSPWRPENKIYQEQTLKIFFSCNSAAHFDFFYQHPLPIVKSEKKRLSRIKLALDLCCFSLSTVVKRLKVFLRCQESVSTNAAVLSYQVHSVVTSFSLFTANSLPLLQLSSLPPFFSLCLTRSLFAAAFNFSLTVFTTTFSSFSIIFPSIYSAQSILAW